MMESDVATYEAATMELPSCSLIINLTRETVRDEFHRYFGTPDRIIIDVDGERHEYDADTIISLLERYEIGRNDHHGV